MKKIHMLRDFDYKIRHTVQIRYEAGQTYKRVPEAAAKEILKAEAGEVIKDA